MPIDRSIYQLNSQIAVLYFENWNIDLQRILRLGGNRWSYSCLIKYIQQKSMNVIAHK